MRSLRFLRYFVLISIAMLESAAGQGGAKLSSFGIEKLAFEVGPGSFAAPHEDIFILDSAMSKPKRLATGTNAVWSPDGQEIAYCAHEGWGTLHIVLGQMQVINTDGSGHKQLTNLPGGACPIGWSRDGQKIVFGGSTHGMLILARDEKPATVLPGPVGMWSPDESKLAFWKYRESRNSSGSIWIANADGTDPKKVIDDNSEVVELARDPDGKSILFCSEREHKGKSQIFRVALDGTNLGTVAEDEKLSFFSPVISPDGKFLVVDAYPAHGSGASTIMILDFSNHSRTVLAHGTHPHIVWQKPL